MQQSVEGTEAWGGAAGGHRALIGARKVTKELVNRKG